jgi:hypothetical protein
MHQWKAMTGAFKKIECTSGEVRIECTNGYKIWRQKITTDGDDE